MSLEFSRRAFLKYSAVAAVALAGAGVFSGCEQSDPYNLYMYKAGEMTVLQITAGMGYDATQKKYVDPTYNVNSEKVVLPFKITNGRTNALPVILSNFKVVVTDKDGKEKAKFNSAKGLTCAATLLDTNLKKGSSVSGDLTVDLRAATYEKAAGDKLVLTYTPDHEYAEYSLNWVLTCAAVEESSGGEGTGGEGAGTSSGN